jgi:N-acetylmuramic acid 6-phosphate etherase
VLNTITTLAMVRLGKVYQNLMVDLRASNQKLWDRGARILTTVTGLPREPAMDLLRRADGHVKVAIVMHERGVNAEQAKSLLHAAGGALRAAIGR